MSGKRKSQYLFIFHKSDVFLARQLLFLEKKIMCSLEIIELLGLLYFYFSSKRGR